MMILRDNDHCYVCGSRNQTGLRIHFEIQEEEKTLRGRFTPLPEHQGFEGLVHGGILSAMLDEAMAKLAFSLGLPAVTAEMTVKFKASAAPGDELIITGKLITEAKKLITAEAKIERGLVIIAEATGKLLRVA